MNTSMIYMAASLVGLAVFLAVLGFRNVVHSRDRDQILKRISGPRDGNEARSGRATIYLTDRPLPLPATLIAMCGWLLPNLLTSEGLQWDLFQAGFRHPKARALFAGAKVLLTILFTAGAIVVAKSTHMTSGTFFLTVVSGPLVGYFLPSAWLTYKQSRRRQEIMLSLPDGLDLMVICVEAGQGLNAALLSVGREMSFTAPALSEELQVVNYEIRMGVSRGQALRNFAARTGVEEARALAAVLIQSDRLGTSVARALRVHAQTMRTRRRQRAEEAARKTPVKLVFPLVLFIFPALLVVILAPAMLQLYRVLSQSAQG